MLCFSLLKAIVSDMSCGDSRTDVLHKLLNQNIFITVKIILFYNTPLRLLVRCSFVYLQFIKSIIFCKNYTRTNVCKNIDIL